MKTLFTSFSFFILLFSYTQNFNWTRFSDVIVTEQFTLDNDNNIIFPGNYNCQDTCFFNQLDLSAGYYVDSTVFQNCKPTFLSKVDSSGNQLWFKKLTDTCGVYYYSVETDQEDNIYLLGVFNTNLTFMPNQIGEQNIQTNGTYDVIVSKFNPDGDLIWNHTLGSLKSDWGLGLTIKDNYLYIIGEIQDTVDFDLSVGVFNLNIAPSSINTYIAKYDLDANLQWAKILEGQNNRGRDVGVDRDGNVFISGKFRNTIDFDPSASSLLASSVVNNRDDGYLAKYDSNGNYNWHIHLQENALTVFEDHKISIDNCGDVLYCGILDYNDSLNVNPNGAAKYITKADTSTNPVFPDFYLAKFNTNGLNEWAYLYGGPSDDAALAVTVDKENNAYFSAIFSGTIDADPGSGVVNYSTGGINIDAIIIGFDKSGNYISSSKFGTPIPDRINDIHWQNNQLVTTIHGNPNIDLDPTNNEFIPIDEGYIGSFGASFLTSFSLFNPPQDTTTYNLCINDTFYYNGSTILGDTVIVDNLVTAQGCDSVNIISVKFNINPPLASFTINQIDSMMFVVNLQNTSTNYDSLFWDFGDGSTSIEQNPIHNYSSEGEYVIQLTAFNELCQITSFYVDTVSFLDDGTNVHSFEKHINLLVYPNPTNKSLIIQFENDSFSTTKISLKDFIGKTILYKETSTNKLRLNCANMSKGVYLLTIQQNGRRIDKKIVIN